MWTSCPEAIAGHIHIVVYYVVNSDGKRELSKRHALPAVGVGVGLVLIFWTYYWL